MSEAPVGFHSIVRQSREVEELKRFIKARKLLVSTIDTHRAIIGPVSTAWILSEVERRVPWEKVPPQLQKRLCPASGAPPRAINTNWLPKLEPALNAHILAGVILFGARLFGHGTPDNDEGVSFQEIDHDIVIAGMIHGTFGLRDAHSAFLPERQRIVEEHFLQEQFGEGVLHRVWALREMLAIFEMALKRNLPMPFFPREYANAIAAIMTARLRLTARAAGDRIFATLDEPKRAELLAAGIDPGDPDAVFPERPYLERDFLAARAAISLPGVDGETILEPVRDVLLRGIEHVLYHGTGVHELVGKYGSAIRNFHCALPLWERYSPIVRRTLLNRAGEMVEIAGPFALGTLYRTSLEVTRYLHAVRRKGGGTGAGHSFLVSSRVEILLDRHLSIPVVAGSDCHDVVEDGGFSVAGYDQNLELFALRFGAPLAALVSEVTDPLSKEDGPVKAVATARSPTLVPMEKAYNLGQLAELRSRATDPDMPFTLQGIIMKLADFGTTKEEGLHDPALMTGVWRHSGARICWDQTSKGRIVRPLIDRLLVEINISRTDPFYHQREGSLPTYLLGRLWEVVRYTFDIADLYMVQNLAILAAEYDLTAKQRQTLLEHFLSDERLSDESSAFFDGLLDDSRLDPTVRRKGLTATYMLVPQGDPVRDLTRLVDYRKAARWRAKNREDIGLPPLSAAIVEEVLLHWERSMTEIGALKSARVDLPTGESSPTPQNPEPMEPELQKFRHSD